LVANLIKIAKAAQFEP